MVQFTCKSFHELSVDELYEILALRQEVFIVEQNCPYLDCDGKDQQSHHLMGHGTNGKLVVYSRLLPPGVSYQSYMSIGRVVSAISVRGTGMGRALMHHSIEECHRLFGHGPIKIGAQSYLLDFYASFGFESTGEEYLEDGIPHTKMVRG